MLCMLRCAVLRCAALCCAGPSLDDNLNLVVDIERHCTVRAEGEIIDLEVRPFSSEAFVLAFK